MILPARAMDQRRSSDHPIVLTCKSVTVIIAVVYNKYTSAQYSSINLHIYLSSSIQKKSGQSSEHPLSFTLRSTTLKAPQPPQEPRRTRLQHVVRQHRSSRRQQLTLLQDRQVLDFFAQCGGGVSQGWFKPAAWDSKTINFGTKTNNLGKPLQRAVYGSFAIGTSLQFLLVWLPKRMAPNKEKHRTTSRLESAGGKEK